MRKILTPIQIAALHDIRIMLLKDQLKKELEFNNEPLRYKNIKKIEMEINTAQSVINYYEDEICEDKSFVHNKMILGVIL